MFFNFLRLYSRSRLIVGLLVPSFLLTGTVGPFVQPVYGQTALAYMPAPTERIATTAALELPLLKGIKVSPQDPFKFDFIVDEGKNHLDDKRLKEESDKLIKYFLAGLTIPEEDLWVNLSPYEQDKTVPQALGRTEMGKDLLGQDYVLKQLMASLTYPETELGKEFWNKIYARVYEAFGTTKVPVNTFNKVWIMPAKVVVYEDKDRAFVAEARLKVMLEEDYLALKNNLKNSTLKTDKLAEDQVKDVNKISSGMVKKVMLPIIEEEVNSGEHFAILRQVYHSLILATWFKKKLKEGIVARVYADKNKIKGVAAADPDIKEKIYNQYLEAYKKGVYDYIKKEEEPGSGKTLARRYFSGGMYFTGLSSAAVTTFRPIAPDFSLHAISSSSVGITVQLNPGPVPAPLSSSANMRVPAMSAPTAPKARTASDPQPQYFKQGKSLTEPPAEEDIKKPGRPGFSLTDDFHDFNGIDWDYFFHAITRLATKNLTRGKKEGEVDELAAVLKALGLPESLSSDEAAAYQEIFEKVASGKISPDVFDVINGKTYRDPKVRGDVKKQNMNPQAQGIYEAIANAIDALNAAGLKIGQFSKGVKQILGWLKAKGDDRLDVFTREEGGAVYHITLVRDKTGQLYIQIKEGTLQEFQKEAGRPLTRGTVVKGSVINPIPAMDKDRGESDQNSQEGIISGLKTRYMYNTNAHIFIQNGETSIEEINNKGEKEVWVGVPYDPKASDGKNVNFYIDDHTFVIVDDGSGMNAETATRMFTRQGTKISDEIAEADIPQKLHDEVKLVLGHSFPAGISFARNGEVITVVAIPDDLVEGSAMTDGVLLDLGSFLRVQDSRDNIIIPLEEHSHFRQAVEYVVRQVIDLKQTKSGRLVTNQDKVKMINTIVVGLEGLKKPGHAKAIDAIEAVIKEILRPTIKALREEGYEFLPHDKQFGMIDRSEKKTLYLSEKIFDWQGAQDLVKIGAKTIRGIRLGGEDELAVLMMPFVDGDVSRWADVTADAHQWNENERKSCIKTEKLIVVSEQAWQRLYALDEKRLSGQPFSDQEQREYASLLERLNIASAEPGKVDIGGRYDKKRQENIRAVPLSEITLVDKKGRPDFDALQRFVEMAVPRGVRREASQRQGMDLSLIKDGQRYVRLEGGKLLNVETGAIVPTAGPIQYLEYLSYGYYFMHYRDSAGGRPEVALQNPDLNISRTNSVGTIETVLLENDLRFFVSKSKRYFGVGRENDFGLLIDLKTGKKYWPSRNSANLEKDPQGNTMFLDFQFSHDEQYATYVEYGEDGKEFLVIIDLTSDDKTVKRESITSDAEYSLSPFANVAFIDYKWVDAPMMGLIDLSEGQDKVIARSLHTDSTGAMTVIGRGLMPMSHGPHQEKNAIYLHQAKQLVTLGTSEISSLEVRWEGGVVYYVVNSVNPAEAPVVFRLGGIGEMIPDELPTNPDYAEKISLATDKIIYRGIAKNGKILGIEAPAPFQSGCKHPHLNLFITNFEDYSIAMDTETGHMFKFEGEIVAYYPASAAPGRKVVVIKDKDGVLQVGVVTSASNQVGALSPLGKFVVGADNQAVTDGVDKWGLWNLVSGSETKLDIDINKFTEASFDGQHFVFVNPKTGDTVYLDPAAPDKPLKIPRQQEKAHSQATSTEKPAGIKRELFLRDSAIWEIGTGKIVPRGAGVEKLEPLGNGFYKVTTRGTEEILEHSIGDDAGRGALPTFSVRRTEGKIKVSPDNWFVYVELNDGTVGSGDLLLPGQEGKILSLQEIFNLPNASYSNLQFSQDGKSFLVTQEWVGKKSLAWARIDPDTGEVVNSGVRSMLGNSFEYAVNPFSNMAFLKSHDRIDLFFLIDMATGDSVISGDFFHADPTGALTVVVQGGEKFIYLHKAKKLMTAADFGLKNIGDVNVKWKDGQAYFVVFGVPLSGSESPFDGFGLSSPAIAKVFQISDDGSIVDAKLEGIPDYQQEIFTVNGKPAVNFCIPNKKDVYIEGVDPLQRPDRRGGYKHPHFDLFIDNSDLEQPQAIDVKTGAKFKFPDKDGEIVRYDADKHELFFRETDGRISRHVDIGGSFAGLTTTKYIVSDKVPSKYIVALGVNHYELHGDLETRPIDGIDYRKYTEVFADGKYFVFVDPETGEALYFDPEALASAKPEPLKPVQPTGKVFPDKAGQRFVLLDGGKVVQMGEAHHARFDKVTYFQWLGGGHYHAVIDGRHVILRVIPVSDKAQALAPVSLTGMETDMTHDPFSISHKEGSIKISPDGRFAYLEKTDGTLVDTGLLNLQDGKIYDLAKDFNVRTDAPSPSNTIFSRIQFSSDGRYITGFAKYQGGELWPFFGELKVGSELISPELRGNERVTDLAVNPFANVAFWKQANGHMQLIDLDKEGLVETPRPIKYLRTDSSGLFTTIVYDNDELGIYQHTSEHRGLIRYLPGNIGGIETYYDEAGQMKVQVEIDDQYFDLTNEGKMKPAQQVREAKWAEAVLSGLKEIRVMRTSPDWVRGLLTFDELGTDSSLRGESLYLDKKFNVIVKSESTDVKVSLRDGDKVKTYTIPLGSKIIMVTQEGLISLSEGRLFRSFMTESGEWRLPFVGAADEAQGLLMRFEEEDAARGTKARYHLYAIKDGTQIAELKLGEIDPIDYEEVTFDGKYFVFTDTQTGKSAFYSWDRTTGDETLIFVAANALTAPQEQEEGQDPATLLAWKTQVHDKLEAFIKAETEGSLYGELIDLFLAEPGGESAELQNKKVMIPTAVKAAVAGKMKPYFEKLWQEVQGEIQKRFQDFQDGKSPEVSLDNILPLQSFQEKLRVVLPHLSTFLGQMEGQLVSVKFGTEKKSWEDLFSGVMDVLTDGDVSSRSLEELNLEDLFTGFAAGVVSSPSRSRIPAVEAIGKLINELRDVDPQIKPQEIREVTTFFKAFISDAAKGDKNAEILKTQISTLLALPEAAKRRNLKEMWEGFKQLMDSEEGIQIAIQYLATGKQQGLGKARPYVVFLTNEVKKMQDNPGIVPQLPDGEDWFVAKSGQMVYPSQIMALLEQMAKTDENQHLSVEYLIDKINKQELPPRNKKLDDEFKKLADSQTDTGGYTREDRQNAGDGGATRLVVSFYVEKNEHGQEIFYEVVTDNGAGAPHGVLITAGESVKEALPEEVTGESEEDFLKRITGVNGTGKFTNLEGVDQWTVINRNQDSAFMFTWGVRKDSSGALADFGLVRVRKITDHRIAQGVTVRREKKLDDTIPELDRMIAEDNWKRNIGLSLEERAVTKAELFQQFGAEKGKEIFDWLMAPERNKYFKESATAKLGVANMDGALKDAVMEKFPMNAAEIWGLLLRASRKMQVFFVEKGDNGELKEDSLAVKQEVVGEVDFVAGNPENDEAPKKNLGPLQVISVQDPDLVMSLVDGNGYLIGPIPDEFLALIPYPLRGENNSVLKKFGLAIGIPSYAEQLPLTRGRNALEDQDYYLPFLQQSVATAFYKAVAKRMLEQSKERGRGSRAYSFEGFSPYDYLYDRNYGDVFDPQSDQDVVTLARKINNGQEITEAELGAVKGSDKMLDFSKRFIKLLLLIEAEINPDRPGEAVSLFDTRNVLMEKFDKEQAADERRRIGASRARNRKEVEDLWGNNNFSDFVARTSHYHVMRDQTDRVEDLVVAPQNDQERALLALAQDIIREVRGQDLIKQVVLVKREAMFNGLFGYHPDETGVPVPTMFLNLSLADEIGTGSSRHQCPATYTIVHELGHLVERLQVEKLVDLFEKGYATEKHKPDEELTHDINFACAMIRVAMASVTPKTSGVVGERAGTRQVPGAQAAFGQNKSSPAKTVAPVDKGGIDLNTVEKNMEIKGQGGSLPSGDAPFDVEHFEGFTFDIIRLERLAENDKSFASPAELAAR